MIIRRGILEVVQGARRSPEPRRAADSRGRRGVRGLASISVGIVAATALSLGAPALTQAQPSPPPSASPPPTRLTLPAAIEAALTKNRNLQIESANIEIADSRTAADSRSRGPQLALSANLLLWDSEIVAELGGARIPIRSQVTGSVDLTLAQPISGAYIITKLVERDRAAASVSRARADSLRIELAYQTAAAYLGALQAQTLAEVTRASLAQLDAALRQARDLVDSGRLSAVDVLRLEAERARFELQLLEAETQALGSRRALASLLALPDGTELALVDVDTTPPPLSFTEDEAVRRARRDHPDAEVARASSEVAALGVDVTRTSYLPSVSLLAVASHAINAGSLGSANSAYLGVALDWNLWDWGKRGAEVDGARAASRQAQLRQQVVADQLAVDTRGRWQAVRTAALSIDVSARGLAAAAEARRLQATRFELGAATTVELLDAETALARAQAQAVIERYRYLVAWMALGRSVGALPSAPSVAPSVAPAAP